MKSHGEKGLHFLVSVLKPLRRRHEGRWRKERKWRDVSPFHRWVPEVQSLQGDPSDPWVPQGRPLLLVLQIPVHPEHTHTHTHTHKQIKEVRVRVPLAFDLIYNHVIIPNL